MLVKPTLEEDRNLLNLHKKEIHNVNLAMQGAR